MQIIVYMPKYVSPLIFLLFVLFYTAIAQDKKGSIGEPIILNNADSLVGMKTSETGHVRKYMGNVEFEQGDIFVTCDFATHYMDENRADLFGNVHIYQQDMLLTAPRIYYNGNTKFARASKGVQIIDERSVLTAKRGTYSLDSKIADFEEEVVIEDDSARIISDRLIHHRESENSYAYGNVFIRGKHTNALLTADTVRYYPSKNYTLAIGEPLLFKVDTTKKEDSIKDSINAYILDSLMMPPEEVEYEFDTLSVAADTIEANRGVDMEEYHFTENVEIVRSDVSAKAKKSLYDKRLNYISLQKNPIVWYDSTQLYADSTVIYIKENRLNKIVAFGSALAATRDDTIDTRRINQITGKKIMIEFKQDSLDRIAGFGEVKSLYFLSDEKSADGVDQKAADTILINFERGDPDNIVWKGGVDAKLYPENMVAPSPGEFYLPGFLWTDDRPKKRKLEIRKVDEY